jgi:hypothetical protein
MNRKQPQHHVSFTNTTVTMGAAGAGRAFVENIQHLYNLVEGISSADGLKTQVQSVRFTFRMYSESNFSILPIVLQTAGNFTDTVDIDITTYISTDRQIDQAVDDVFGFYPLSQFFKTSRRVPTSDASAATGKEHSLQFSVDIPRHLIVQLNKETETERLQNLFLGFLGLAYSNDQVIIFTTIMETRYVLIRKNIILR